MLPRPWQWSLGLAAVSVRFNLLEVTGITGAVTLEAELLSVDGLAGVPAMMRIAAAGSRPGPAPVSLPTSREALRALMLNVTNVLLKRTAERDFALREVALDVIGALTGRFACGRDSFVQGVDLEALLRDGLLRCGLAGPSGVFSLLHSFLTQPTMRAALLYECCRLLPQVRKLAASPARTEEFLTLLFDAAASQPLVAIEALRTELLGLSRFLLSSPERHLHARLFARYGLAGLPLAKGCFDLQGALGSRASRVLPRGFTHGAPLTLTLRDGMPKDRTTGAVCAVLKPPMATDGIVFRRQHLVCHRSAGYVVLEPPSPVWLTGIALSSASTLHSVDVAVYALVDEGEDEDEEASAVPGTGDGRDDTRGGAAFTERPLLAASLIPLTSSASGPHGQAAADDDNQSRVMKPAALQCRRLLLRWRLHDPPTGPEPAPADQLFTTPPDGLGHVLVNAGSPTHGAAAKGSGALGPSQVVTPLKRGGPQLPADAFSTPYGGGSGSGSAPPQAKDAFPLDIALTLRLAVFGHLLFEPGADAVPHSIGEKAQTSPAAGSAAAALALPSKNSPYGDAAGLSARAYHASLEEEDTAAQRELGRRQYALRELLEAADGVGDSSSSSSGGDGDGMVEVAHGSCCEMQAEAVCIRWTLRQFRANHVALGQRLPALLSCDNDRAFLTAEGLVQHYLGFVSRSPLAEQCVLVRDLSDACALYDAFCHEQPPGLGDAVFELLKRSPALDQQAWSSFILHALERKFGGATEGSGLGDVSPAFFEPLRAIAQKHHLTQPSMYNPLLMAIVEYARRSSAPLVVVEAAFYLLASSLPVLAVAAAAGANNGGGAAAVPPLKTGAMAPTAGVSTGNRDNAQITVFMIDANRCRTLFRIRRTTALHKMFQAFCEVKDVNRRECEFLWHGQVVDGSKSAAQLGLGHEDAVQVVWRPTQTVRPALSQQRQLDLLGAQHGEDHGRAGAPGDADAAADAAAKDALAATPTTEATPPAPNLMEMAAAKTDMFYTGGSDGRPLEIFMTPAREMGSRLGAIPVGASVKVLACSGDWAKVRSGALVGWCHARAQGRPLLTADPRPALALSRKRWYKVTTMVGDGGLEVRVAPRLTAAIVGHIFAGQRVQARQLPGEEWLEIDLHRQTRAFVLAKRDRGVYAVPDETHSDTTAHVIIDIAPGEDLRGKRAPAVQAPSGLAPQQLYFSRMACVAEVLLEYCRSLGVPFDAYTLYLRGAPLLGYLTLAEAAVSSGDCLELRPRPPQGIPDDFITVVVRSNTDYVIVKLLRNASVSCVCDQYCVRKQAEGQETTFTFHGQHVLPYDTPASLGLRDMDVLEASIAGLKAASAVVPTAHAAAAAAEEEEEEGGGDSADAAKPDGDAAATPVKPAGSTCKGIAMTYLETLQAHQGLNEQMEEHAEHARAERETLAAAIRNKTTTPQAGLDGPDVVPGSLPEIEEFLPLHLMALAASRRLLEPPSRQLLILICHVLERISLNCSWRSLMWVFRHERFEALLRAVARSEDAELQEAVTHMIVALCDHISTLSDARCCDAETVHVVAPHPLVRYSALVRSLVDELLESEAGVAQLSYSRQLPFLLHLVVPRHGVASSLTVDYHPHSLAASRRKMQWRCHACNTTFAANDGTMRFRCAQGCDFNLCIDCLPYANPEFAQEVVSWGSLERLLRAVAARRLYPRCRQDAQLAVLALTLARWADPRAVVEASATWSALETCALSPSEAVGLQLRGAMRALLQTLLSHAHLAQKATREVLKLVSRTLARDPRPSAPLLLDMLNSLTEQGATVLCADVDTLVTLTDAIGQLAAVAQTNTTGEGAAWGLSTVDVLQHLQHLLTTALDSCRASQLVDNAATVAPESPTRKAGRTGAKEMRGASAARQVACEDLNAINLLRPAACENMVAALMAIEGPAGTRGVGKITAEVTACATPAFAAAAPSPADSASRADAGESTRHRQPARLYDASLDTATACGRHDSAERLLYAVLRAVISASEASTQALVRVFVARRFDIAAHNPESPALSILTLALRRPAVVLDFVRELDGLGFLLNLIEASGRNSTGGGSAPGRRGLHGSGPGGANSGGSGGGGSGTTLSLTLHGRVLPFTFASSGLMTDMTAVRILQQVVQTAQRFSEVQSALAEDEKLLRLFVTIAGQAPRFHCLAEDVLNGLGTLRSDLAHEVARNLLRAPYHAAKARALAHLASTQAKPSRRAWAPELAKLLLDQRHRLEGHAAYLHALAGELRDSTVGQIVEKTPLWPELLAVLLQWLVSTYRHLEAGAMTRPGLVWSANWAYLSADSALGDVDAGKVHTCCASRKSTPLTPGCRIRLRAGAVVGHRSLPRGAEGTFISMQAGIRWDDAPQQLAAMVPLDLLELAPRAARVVVGDAAYVAKDVARLTRQQGLPWDEWRDGDLAGKIVTVSELLPGRNGVRVAANGISCVVAANALRPMLTSMTEMRVRDRTEASAAAWSVVHWLLSGPVAATAEDRLDVVIRVFRPAGAWGDSQKHVETNALALSHAALLVGPLRRALLTLDHAFGSMAQAGLLQALQLDEDADADADAGADVDADVTQAAGADSGARATRAALEGYGWLLFWSHLATEAAVAGVAREIVTPERVVRLAQAVRARTGTTAAAAAGAAEAMLLPLEMLTAALWSQREESLRQLASCVSSAQGALPLRLLRRWWFLDAHAVHITLQQRPIVGQSVRLDVPAGWLRGARPDGAVELAVPPTTTVGELAERLYGPQPLAAIIRCEVHCCGCRLFIDGREYSEDSVLLLAGPDTQGQPLRMRIDAIFAGTIWVSSIDGATRHFLLHTSDLEAGVWTAPLAHEMVTTGAPADSGGSEERADAGATTSSTVADGPPTAAPSVVLQLPADALCCDLAARFGSGADGRMVVETFVPVTGGSVGLALCGAAGSATPRDASDTGLRTSLNPVLEAAIDGGHLRRLALEAVADTGSAAFLWAKWMERFASLCELPHFAAEALRSTSIARTFWAILDKSPSLFAEVQADVTSVDAMTDAVDEVLVRVIENSSTPAPALEALRRGMATQTVQRLTVQSGDSSTLAASDGDDDVSIATREQTTSGAVKVPELGLVVCGARVSEAEGGPSQPRTVELGSAGDDTIVGWALWAPPSSPPLVAGEAAAGGDMYVEVMWLEDDAELRAGGHPKAAALGTTLAAGPALGMGMLGRPDGSTVSHGLELHSGQLCAGDDRQPMGVMAPAARGDILGCGLKGDFLYFTRNGQLVAGFHSVSRQRPLRLAITGTNGARVAIVNGTDQDAGNRHCFSAEQRQAASVDTLVASGLVCAPAAGLLTDGDSTALHRAAHSWDAAGADQRRAKRVWREMMQLRLLRAMLEGVARAPEAANLALAFLEGPQGSRLSAYVAERLDNDSFNDMSRQRLLYTALARVLGAVAQLDGRAAASWLRPLSAKMGAQAQRAKTYLHVSSVSGGSQQALLSLQGNSGDIARLAKALVTSHRAVVARLEKASRAAQEEENKAAATAMAAAAASHSRGQEGSGSALGSTSGPATGSSSPPVRSTAAYTAALQRWRLCFLGGFFSDGHYFEANLGESLPRSTTSALSSELTDAREGLPCDPSNAVFFAVTDVQLNLLKVLVTGVEGTPYSGGCFVFDVYCPPEYPRGPPKVMLVTTGNGSVRFNPNLYNNGKVCLSLLGTWEGEGGETWTANSSLHQIFASIQSLIMTSGVYFNEPGYEHLAGTADGKALNQGYVNIVRYATVKYAMLAMLRHPPRSFEYIVRAHFFHQRHSLVAQCRRWLEEAGEAPCTEANYGGLVAAHNAPLAAKFKAGPLAFQELLRGVVEELCDVLASLTEPELPASSEDEESSDSDSDEEDGEQAP